MPEGWWWWRGGGGVILGDGKFEACSFCDTDSQRFDLGVHVMAL